MARKRVVEEPALKSWEDVNDALRQIAEAKISLGEIEGEMQKEILKAKDAAQEIARPFMDEIAQLERDIRVYTTAHRDELGDEKSRTLPFGVVGFHASTSISLPKDKDALAEIIRRLKSRGMLDCIIVKEAVSKEVLKKYGEDTVNAVGAVWRRKNKFNYDVDIAKLEQIKAGG